MLQNIKETLDYIYSFVNLESNLNEKYLDKEYSLTNIENILKYFDNPHKNIKIIHIAGTKGKGSVSLMISKLLIELGFFTCTFLSPHLVNPNERILYNLKEIGDDRLINITNQIKIILEKNNLCPTTFEIFFLIFLIFSKECNADYLVIEVGLGGRLDCTNIVNPMVSAITSIGYDHTNILGNTIKKIAFEKAGIIKPDSKVILGKQYYNCKNIFKRQAIKEKSDFFDIEKIFKVKKIISNEKGLIFDFYFQKEEKRINNFFLPVFGLHQIYNFLTAFYSIYVIFPEIFDVLYKNKKLEIELNGRIKLINDKTPIIVDVSHNKESARELVKTLRLHYPNKKWNILLGLAYDKDIISFIKIIRKIANKIIVTNLSQYKKSEPVEIYKTAKRYFKKVELISEQKEAFQKILNENQNILVTGSFYIAGPFLDNYSIFSKTFS
ncbi:MAG TPA: Mur ligase family protein [Spirochaetota bacterium]|nr:Mur ligase family protein [Spirochaetota bacterium]